MSKKIARMSEGKKNIITALLQEYDIQSAEDIQEALKELMGETIKEMLEAEMDEHLGYETYERSENPNFRNGYKQKQIRSKYGEATINVPRAEYQRCIVHQVRNILKYVPDKDKKEFAKDLKTIYEAANEEDGYKNMEAASEKWTITLRNWGAGIWRIINYVRGAT